MATTKLWTIEDVARLPDDVMRYALIRRELYRRPPPKAKHGRITLAAGRFVGKFVAEHSLGAVYDQSGFIFQRDPDTLLGPDLAFVQAAHVPADENVYPELAPDLVIEVVSPSQTGPSIEENVVVYPAAGVRLIWAIDPEQKTVRVHRPTGPARLLNGGDILDGEDVLPGFRLPVTQIFA